MSGANVGENRSKSRARGLFSTGDAAKISGVPMRTVDYWDRIGLVKPSIRTHGSGFSRYYKLPDLVVLKAMGALQHETNIELRRGVAAQIRNNPGQNVLRVKHGPFLELVLDLLRLRQEVKTRSENL